MLRCGHCPCWPPLPRTMTTCTSFIPQDCNRIRIRKALVFWGPCVFLQHVLLCATAPILDYPGQGSWIGWTTNKWPCTWILVQISMLVLTHFLNLDSVYFEISGKRTTISKNRRLKAALEDFGRQQVFVDLSSYWHLSSSALQHVCPAAPLEKTSLYCFISFNSHVSWPFSEKVLPPISYSWRPHST